MEKKTKQKIEWKQLFLFTKDGRVKSTDLLYAFFIGVATVFVNFLISNRLTILFETLLDGQSRFMKNAVDTLVPTLLCMLIAALVFRLMRRKSIVCMAYWCAWLLVTVFLATILFTYDRETLEVLLWPLVCIFEVPAAANAILATGLFWHWRKGLPVEDDEAFDEEADGEDA